MYEFDYSNVRTLDRTLFRVVLKLLFSERNKQQLRQRGGVGLLVELLTHVQVLD